MIHEPGTTQVHSPAEASLPPNLDAILLAQGLLDHKELELAKHYQNRMIARGHPRSLAQILVELGLVDKNVLDQIITLESVNKGTGTVETPSQIEDLIRTRTEQLQKRFDLLRSATEITRQAISSPTLYELLQCTSNLIVEYYGYDFAAFFLLNETDHSLRISQYSHSPGIEATIRDVSISLDTKNGIAWTFRNKQVYTSSYDGIANSPTTNHILPETRSEVCIPISIDDKMLGILNVQSRNSDAFVPDAVSILQGIMANISPVIHYHQSMEATKEILGKLSVLYQVSQGFTQVRTSEEVYQHTLRYLKQLSCHSQILAVDGNHWRPIAVQNETLKQDCLQQALETNRVTPNEIEDNLIFQEYLLFREGSPPTGLTESLKSALQSLGYSSIALVPLQNDHQIGALIFLYSDNSGSIDQNTLQFCGSLADLAASSLQRVQLLENMVRRLNRLEVLDSISQAITVETDLNSLYRVIHEQITSVMGDVNLIIAIYEPETNTIEIPYAYEEHRVLSIPSFELGEGLTSILIKTGKPLLLVKDTEKRAKELGAKVVGAPAKSWLGVPLLLGGQAIGAIIVQDLEKEHRFDEEDQRLLNTLSSQVAVTVRNARLINESLEKAKHERDAIDITNKLWSATDVDTILRTALGELGKTLHASNGMIQLEIDESELIGKQTEATQS